MTGDLNLNLGLSPSVVNWFRDYLTNGSQVVRINNTYSEPLPMSYGVPQGSILGPLMLLLYINDLPFHNFKSKIISYADDLVMYTSDYSWENVNATLLGDLQKLYSWSLFNRLTVNYSKSKLQIFGSKRLLKPVGSVKSINFGNRMLERVNEFNTLRFILTLS